MKKIFFLMGKTASGKTTVYQRLLKECPDLSPVITYTTRPMRDGEIQGVDYHFVSETELEELEEKRKVIEKCPYWTVEGLWIYATVDDGFADVQGKKFLLIGTLESYKKVKDYFGKETVVPIYIEADDGIRLERSLARERGQKEPHYAEACRRFLSDERDFSPENLKKYGITDIYSNVDIVKCVNAIKKTIKESV